MKRLETVYWKPIRKYRKARFLSDYTFPAVRIQIGKDELLVAKNEIVTESEYQKIQFEKRKEHMLPKLQPVIDAWNKGLRTPREISIATDLFHVAAYQKIKAAKRWKFIE